MELNNGVGTLEIQQVEQATRAWRKIHCINFLLSLIHIRAHETVLDLVCRLLLEKKKTQTTTTSISIKTFKYRTVATSSLHS